MIILDPALKRKGDLDDELTIAPLIIQDSDTGQESLTFAYPIEEVERSSHTLRPFLHMTLKEVDELVS